MSDFNIYLSVFLFISSFVSLFIALFSIRQKEIQAAKSFAFLCFASTMYSFGYAMELLNTKLQILTFWNLFQYVGVEFISYFWLVFTIQYCGVEKLNTRIARLLFVIIPVFNLIILSSNPIHHLFYKDMYVESNGFFPVLSIKEGPFYIVNSLYIVTSVLCSNILFLKLMVQSKGKFQYQSGIMFAASLLPLTAHFMLEFNVIPLGLDVAPFLLTISFLLVLMGLFKYQLLNLIPLAHEKVFENIKDAVIVLDYQFNIVDYNQAAADIFGEINKQAIGKRIDSVLIQNHQFVRLIFDSKDKEYKHEGKSGIFYSVKISILHDKSNNIIGYIITMNNITKQIEFNNRLQILASIDNLTETLNRGAFLAVCNQELSKVKELNSSLTLLMLDLDHFKKVNDLYGHQAGDALLREVAKVCQASIRSNDILGRFGGEEFMVLLPMTPIAEAIEIGDRIRKNIEALTVIFDNQFLKITVSIGISGADQITQENIDLLIKYADEALYQAKKNGRNCVKIVPV